MIQIISGTNRPGSFSLKLSNHILHLLVSEGAKADVLDLAKLDFSPLNGTQYSANGLPPSLSDALEKVNAADGLLFVIPEYNGSYPGVLKYFIDHWKYPESFEKRPVAFTGLGWAFGGLRPVEHMMQVMSYRNAFIFPERVFIKNAPKELDKIENLDSKIQDLLKSQAKGFTKFVKALKSEKMDANSIPPKSK